MNHTINKSLGQHWLKDKKTLAKIVAAADVSKGDVILEIGPGTGYLTDELLARRAEIVALEIDRELVKKLEKKYINRLSTEVFIQEGDVRTYDLNNMPPGYKIVANIPYYLTSNLIRIISESKNPPNIATLLIQKEVAERVAAKPGDMSLLSVTAQFYWQVKLGEIVKAELFTPPPKVDSQILTLKRREVALFPEADEKKFFRVVKAGFSARRKTLLNSLSGGLRLSKADAGELLERAGVDPGLRAQSLSLPRWHDIYRVAIELGLLE